jgi:3-ketosteroid 9alpha-monooxygenase subunit A
MTTSRFPFSPNPYGWYVVATSDEVAAGSELAVRYFGCDLVVFRNAAGRAVVLDALCLPTKGVAGGRAGAWPVCERNGFVFAHYHPAGAAPAWEIPEVAEHDSEAWTPYFRRRWKIKTHIQEMVENAFDAAHFRYLHKLHNHPQPEIRFNGPLFQLKTRTVQETPFGVIDGHLDIDSRGFGFGVVRFSGLIDTLLFTTITPIDADYVDARFTFSVRKLPDPNATRVVGEGFVDELGRQVDEDIRIWEHKAYLERPLLVAEDAAIAAFRRWARQFYPAEESAALEPAPVALRRSAS